MVADIKPIDLANAALGLASLTIALLALKKATEVGGMAISRPLVLERLYALNEYRKTRELSQDPIKDIARLFNEIGRVRQAAIVLEQAGLTDELHAFESALDHYTALATKLKAVSHPTQDQGDSIIASARTLDKAIQQLLGNIEPQLRRVMNDPLRKWSR